MGGGWKFAIMVRQYCRRGVGQMGMPGMVGLSETSSAVSGCVIVAQAEMEQVMLASL